MNTSNQDDLNVNIPMTESEQSTKKPQKQRDNIPSNNNTTNPNEKVDFTNFLQHANNPIVVFFTLIFKVAAAIM